MKTTRPHIQYLGAHVLGDYGNGTSARDNTQKIVPSSTNTPTMLLDQVLEGNAHLLFNNTGVVDVTTDTEKLGSLIPFTPKSGEPTRTSSANRGCDSNGLNVGDSGGTTEETNVCGEGGFQPGFALFALDGFNQGCFFTADIGAGTAVDVNVKVVSGATGVFSNETGLVRLVDGLLKVRGFLEEFTTDIDVRSARVHGASGNKTTFN